MADLQDSLLEVPSSVNLNPELMSFLVIFVSEIGDKTFLIGAVMAMTNPRLLIFSASMAALGLMTVLSAVLGHTLPNLLSKTYTQILAGALFCIFGVKMLREGYLMSPSQAKDELEEVQQELLEKKEAAAAQQLEEGEKAAIHSSIWKNCENLVNYLFSPVFVQTFVLTFLAEWGDRSQIATIALAGAQDFWKVTLGSLLGHSICTAMAVIGGRFLATKISVRTVTILGGLLFIVFGVLSLAFPSPPE